MDSTNNEFPGDSNDTVFFGSKNCFRSALSHANARKTDGETFHPFFSKASIADIELLLKDRLSAEDSSWKLQFIRDGEADRFNEAIAGLCYGTAALLQRNETLLRKARASLSKLTLFPQAQTPPARDPKQTELDQLAAQCGLQRDDIEDFLSPLESAEDLILLDLWNSSKDPASGVCQCPIAFVPAPDQASILRITVKCLPSHLPVITPDLYYGGSLLWGQSNVGGTKYVPGWVAITQVWECLKSYCPGVRVSIGVEEYNQHQHFSTPILDGHSVQAATALAIWDAWHRTASAASRTAEIEKLHPWLTDFELDPFALATSALNMQGSLDKWTLTWVDGVNAKFRAAHNLQLQLGVTASEKPPGAADELARQPLPYADANTLPELCECMARSSPQLRTHQQRNIDEWHSEFLDEAEAQQFIAERDRTETEQPV